jgi:hypothetical protein
MVKALSERIGKLLPAQSSTMASWLVAGIGLPEAPAAKIKRSGDVTLLDLQQANLDLEIAGPGDITAYGQVGHLNVEIVGSCDVDTSKLPADSARLSIAGSGNIEAWVGSRVHANVSGSGKVQRV